MNLYQKYKDSVLHYVYVTDEMFLKTYAVIKKDDKLYKIYLDRFNYIWKGDSVYQKLNGRGYVPIEEILEKYEIDQIEDLEEQKSKKKIKFYGKRK